MAVLKGPTESREEKKEKKKDSLKCAVRVRWARLTPAAFKYQNGLTGGQGWRNLKLPTKKSICGGNIE